MNWDDLRLLLAIHRAGSLAAAARELGINHSTLYRRLNAFEAAMGLRVFERHVQGYAPTAEGEDILGHCLQIDEAVGTLERRVAGKDFRLNGRIRLTAPSNLCTGYLAAYLPEFRLLHPEIEVELLAGDREYDLARREADLALRATSKPPEYLIGRRVTQLPWWVFGVRGDGVAPDAPVNMAEALQMPMVGPEASLLRLPVFAWLEAQRAQRGYVARASDLATMAALVREGMGLALLPIDQQSEGLRALFPVEPGFSADLWLLTHPDLRQVQRLRVFADFLVAKLRHDSRMQPPSAPPSAT